MNRHFLRVGVLAAAIGTPMMGVAEQKLLRDPRPAIVRAIEQNQLPEAQESRRAAKQRRAASMTAGNTGKTGRSYYSAQKPELPPLPANPFPELKVYDMGNGKYVYDDSEVDYKARNAAGSKTDVGMTDTTQAMSGSEALSSNELRLDIRRFDANSFALQITNLNPGSDYLLTDKLELLDDIGQQWAPLQLFTASSTGVTLTGDFLESSQFFKVWNLDLYSGPVLSISAPAEGAVLSGKIRVLGSVSDFFPTRVAELYVDGDLVTAITNGPFALELDTQQFANGIHTLDVVARTIWLESISAEFATAVRVDPVTFSNALTSIDNGPLFTDAPVLQFSTTEAANYRLEILNESELLIRAFEGTTPGGAFEVSWNMLDGNGNAVPRHATYTFKMTTVSSSSGGVAAAATNQLVIKSFAEQPFLAGQAFLMYSKRSFLGEPYQQVDRDLMAFIQAAIEFADAVGPDPPGRNVFNHELFLWERNDQKTNNILDVIKRDDVGHVYYVGHGSVDAFGRGPDTVVTVNISSGDIKAALSNDFDVVKGVYNFRNTKRYVELNGCVSGTGFLPPAFGVPSLNTDRHRNMKRRSFVGWNVLSTEGWYATRYQQHVQTRDAYWHSVDAEPYFTIQQAIFQAIVDHNYEIGPTEVALHGSRRLTWSSVGNE